VGFLHPTLYAHPEMFHDIVDGYNKGCVNDIAFYAEKGW
jgi:tripeptidyl-peptidase-1